MSGDLISTYSQMATNEFVDDLKSLSLSQTASAYSNTIERLLIQLKQAAPNGFMDNKPFALTIVNNFYRVIPIFDKKLSEKNENFHQTNLFLETLGNLFRGLCLLNLFMLVKDLSRLEIIFHKYISLLKQSYFTDDNTYDHLVNCFLPIIAFSGMMISVNENDLPTDLLTYLLDFTKANLQHEERKRIVNDILGLIKIFSKKPTLVPTIIHYEWPNACIQWLKTNGPRPSYETDFLICLILQKLARHTAGVQVLNQLDCIKVFDESKEQMKKDHNEHDYGSIHFIQCITLALLVEADEIEQKSMLTHGEMCQVLEQIVSFIIRVSRRASHLESFMYKGCHIAEILSVLSKLFLNDDILKKCLRENNQLFDGLSQLLIHFAKISSETTHIYQIINDETLILLANLLWSLSFHQNNHDKFKSNTILMNTVSNLATSSSLYISAQVKSIPRDLSPLKKAAEGILWNLKSSHTILSQVKPEQQPLIMISYCHSDSTFCHELVEQLSHHIPVWVDYKQAHQSVTHSDDLWEEIAHAMEMASVIILIVSNDYYDSKSCRQELCYASDTLKKRILPIYAPNQQYKASGWLGIRIAGQKYVHFGRKDFTDALTELESMIVNDHKAIAIPKSSYETSLTKINEQENQLKNWTSKDVRKWFDDNHIHSDLITLFADQFHTGTSLLVYARHLKLFYRNEYAQILTNYYKRFQGKQLQTVDFITFVDALWRLRETYDGQSKSEDAWEKYNRNQLPYTMKILNEGMTWL